MQRYRSWYRQGRRRHSIHNIDCVWECSCVHTYKFSCSWTCGSESLLELSKMDTRVPLFRVHESIFEAWKHCRIFVLILIQPRHSKLLETSLAHNKYGLFLLALPNSIAKDFRKIIAIVDARIHIARKTAMSKSKIPAEVVVELRYILLSLDLVHQSPDFYAIRICSKLKLSFCLNREKHWFLSMLRQLPMLRQLLSLQLAGYYQIWSWYSPAQPNWILFECWNPHVFFLGDEAAKFFPC